MFFNLETAGHIVRIVSLYENVFRYCEGFVTEKEAEHEICITPEKIAAERQRNNGDMSAYSDDYTEIFAVLRELADYYAGKGILLIHGSAPAVDGRAYVFTAPSGTGKSTHTRLWRETMGDRVTMINDDKPFIDVENGIIAYGSPWNGKHKLGSAYSAPVNGICSLGRGDKNTISRIDSDTAFKEFIKRVYMPDDGEAKAAVIRMSLKVCRSVPFYRMSCNMNPEAAEMSYSAMSGGI